MKWYRDYATEANTEVARWFECGGLWWFLCAPWTILCVPVVLSMYFLFHTSIFLTFLPFFVASRVRRLRNG